MPAEVESDYIDFIKNIGDEYYILGTTQGKIMVFDGETNAMVRTLVERGLAVYHMCFSYRADQLALATDHSTLLVYELSNFNSLGQVIVESEDISSLIYSRERFILVGQAEGYVDVVDIHNNQNAIVGKLHINEAGDINFMTSGIKAGEVLLACQQGLLQCHVSDAGEFQIERYVSEYNDLYCANITWAFDSKFVVVTSDART